MSTDFDILTKMFETSTKKFDISIELSNFLVEVSNILVKLSKFVGIKLKKRGKNLENVGIISYYCLKCQAFSATSRTFRSKSNNLVAIPNNLVGNFKNFALNLNFLCHTLLHIG